ncbi:hypothetical protein [Roseovarius salis]|uniref:hypothetical protein n=1 Tax=Roseovarius salis TaxID=3376063 RepID=UPI0037C5B8B3
MTRQADQSTAQAWTTSDKVAFLSDPRNYRHAPKDVQVVETHMSWVFLAGGLVYKLKKPVTYDFLDFGTPEKRRKAVQDEVRLNRRLARGVYHDPCRLVAGADGRLALGITGHVVDWLVVMRRLPEDHNLETVIAAGGPRQAQLAAVSERLAGFYGRLPAEDVTPDDYAAGFEAEYRITRDALIEPSLGLDGARLQGALSGFEQRFEAIRPVLHRRAEQRRIVEGHGDLRPQHVFLTDPPAIIDCLEFNRRLRLVDPFDEVAFLGMEAASLGARQLFPALASRLSEALDDRPPAALLAFYWSYRALLRARLALLHLAEPHPRTPEKWRPLAWRYIALAEKADVMTRLPVDP